jgi:hypothetical protein
MFGGSNWRGSSAARLFGSRTIAGPRPGAGTATHAKIRVGLPGVRVAKRTGKSARLNRLSWTFPSSA